MIKSRYDKADNFKVLDLTRLSNNDKPDNKSVYFVCDCCINEVRLIEKEDNPNNPHIGIYDKEYLCPKCGVIRNTGLPSEIKRG